MIAMDTNDNTTNRTEELREIVRDDVLLTTLDNPFNPFVQWEQWFAFDVRQGYNTCAYLARIVISSHELSEVEEALAINYAIKEILELNTLGIYIGVTRKTFVDRSKTTSFPTVEIREEWRGSRN
jgi:hypothetical protein